MLPPHLTRYPNSNITAQLSSGYRPTYDLTALHSLQLSVASAHLNDVLTDAQVLGPDRIPSSFMDPATAFSLAGTVLQFIETGSKFVILAWRLYRPSPDSANDFAEASQVTSALSQILEELSHEEDAGETNENGDGCIARLANDCRSVASQLLNVLQSIKLPENGKIRKRDALKAAFRLLWNEDEVKALQSRLEVFRSQLNLHLLHTLR